METQKTVGIGAVVKQCGVSEKHNSGIGRSQVTSPLKTLFVAIEPTGDIERGIWL